MANSNNAYNQFQDLFNTKFDFQAVTALQQKAVDSLTLATKTIFDWGQKTAKAQTEFAQEQAKLAANVASKSLSSKSPEENLDAQTRAAQHWFDANVQNLQSVAKSASDTSVKVFTILNNQAVDHLNSMQKAASHATKKASNS